MKAVLWIKRFDLAAQLGALCIPALMALIAGQYFSIFYAYFFVGGVQIVSYLAHAVGGRRQWTASGRHRYGLLLECTVALALATLGLLFVWNEAGPFALCLGFVYLIVTPIMAIWYFVICTQETRRVAQATDREMLIVRGV